MLLIFPLVYFFAFIFAAKELVKGNMQGVLTYLIFGLSIYTTALSVTFMFGLRDLLPIFQWFKEIIIAIVFVSSLWYLKRSIHFHYIDYMVMAFFGYTLLYAILPVGEQSLVNRLIAFKTISFFSFVYFAGRLVNPKFIFISKYFHYIMLLAVITAFVVLVEKFFNQHLHSVIGLADFNYYVFNMEPSGNYGLSWTFESEGGFKRFASIFASPLEHAGATLIALSVIAGVYTNDQRKLRFDRFGYFALLATGISITLAISRSAFVSYCIIIYVYSIITRKKEFLALIHSGILLAACYLTYLLMQKEEYGELLQSVVINTLNFTHPSSIGHVVEWIQGITSIVQNPLGIGLGSSGRIGSSLGENIGGENQYIIIGVQAGIIALLLYLGIYVSFIKTAGKWYPRLSGNEKKLCLAILLIKIGFIIPSMTSETESSVYISYMTWFLSGVFISIISTRISEQETHAEEGNSRS